MSSQIGKIHHIMIDKIKLNDQIINILSNNEIKQDFDSKNILDIIDENNIHNSLNIAVNKINDKYNLLLKKYPLEILIKRVSNIKKDLSSESSLMDAFYKCDNYMLNGMPCDKLLSIVSNDNKHISFKTDVRFCNDIEAFLELRKHILSYILNDYNITRHNNLYTIKKNDYIDMLYKEHENISNKISLLYNDIINLMQNNIFNKEKFLEYIKFIEEYADNKHHKNEEDILFKYVYNKNDQIKKVIDSGMLVEHLLLRYYTSMLKNNINIYDNKNIDIKLNIIGFAFSYIELINRHIEKENNLVFPLCKSLLTDSENDSLLTKYTELFSK